MDGSSTPKQRIVRKNFTFPEDFLEKFEAIKRERNMTSDSEVLRAAINELYERRVREVREAKDHVEHSQATAAE